MKLYYLENNEVTFKETENVLFKFTCDVLCVGAGCAGLFASMSAAREGVGCSAS